MKIYIFMGIMHITNLNLYQKRDFIRDIKKNVIVNVVQNVYILCKTLFNHKKVKKTMSSYPKWHIFFCSVHCVYICTQTIDQTTKSVDPCAPFSDSAWAASQPSTRWTMSRRSASSTCSDCARCRRCGRCRRRASTSSPSSGRSTRDNAITMYSALYSPGRMATTILINIHTTL